MSKAGLLSAFSGARARSSAAAHPNEFDRRRIARAIEERVRYKYVEPSVMAVPDGYRIESPNCSRNVDPEGGIIDVALITCEGGAWRLYAKNHNAGQWEDHSVFSRLHELLAYLVQDPHREFWQ